jgi:hypothetical protein
MNEKDFSDKVMHALNTGLQQIDGSKLSRLKKARDQAMVAYREPVSILGLVTVTGPTSWVKYNLIQKSLIWLPLIALIAILAGTNVFKEPESEIGELDAALLTGELPINAFLDKDFDTWLRGSE